MQYVKKVFTIIIVVVILFALTAPCFAAISTITDAQLFYVLFDIVGSDLGLTPYLSQNGVIASTDNPMSVSSTNVVEEIYAQFQDSLLSDNPFKMDLSAFASRARANIETNTDVDGYNTIYMPQSTLEMMYCFTNWLLQDVLGLTADTSTSSNVYHTGGTILDPVAASYITEGELTFGPNSMAPVSEDDIIAIYTQGNYTFHCYIEDPQSLFIATNSGRQKVYLLSTIPQSIYCTTDLGGTQFSTGIGNNYVDIDNVRYYYTNVSYNHTLQSWVPTISYFPPNSTDTVAITGADGSQILVKPNKPDIIVPDPDDASYEFQPKTYPLKTKIGSPGVAPTLTDLLDALNSLTNTNAPLIRDPLANDVDPEAVINPFVPFDIPSFNFNFSGIWYYVVNWVNSLRSGFSFISSIWSNIPFAMVIPIYASAVIVIVLGTFKRFLS